MAAWIQTETLQQLLDWLPWNFVQAFTEPLAWLSVNNLSVFLQWNYMLSEKVSDSWPIFWNFGWVYNSLNQSRGHPEAFKRRQAEKTFICSNNISSVLVWIRFFPQCLLVNLSSSRWNSLNYITKITSKKQQNNEGSQSALLSDVTDSFAEFTASSSSPAGKYNKYYFHRKSGRTVWVSPCNL